ncbi:alkaline phosphatase [Agaribacter flavus]|uniref:Alkaline phosphatase n=1 Tax=Agaribacter flavus TaxID=1902781 RepID=A0ABV7FQ86_9ALTE
MSIRIKTYIFAGIASILVSACASEPSKNHQGQKITSETALNGLPKNIVMVVADGMGPAYVPAFRYYMDNPETDELELTVLDDILLGSARTYPAKVSGYVTDSAASATALATGIKTYNGAVGMDVDKQPIETVMHRAKQYGLKTGVAVTSTVVHATPASYMVANESRKNYDAIADSVFDNRIGEQFIADVILGAGTTNFIRDDRNLVSEFQAEGYQYIDDLTQLSTLQLGQPVLGLFGGFELPWALDSEDPTRLRTMTKAALRQLTNDKGFFLLVEASQVDWAGHANDIAGAMNEMYDLAKTVEYLREYVAKHPDTLVIITADHSTGGLTVAASDGYRWDPSWLKGVKASPMSIAKGLKRVDDKSAYLAQQLGFELKLEEKNLLSLITSESPNRDVESIVKRILDKRTNTGWTTNGHTGEDVFVFGFGPQVERFKGQLNNTDIAKNIFSLLDEKHGR